MKPNVSSQNTSLKPLSKKPAIYLLLIIAVIFVVALVFFSKEGGGKPVADREDLAELGFFRFDQSRSISEIPVTNLQGEEKPFLEHVAGWRIVNFGYMSCPDICPINLSLLSDVKTQWDTELGDKGAAELSVVHVTFDPARDTPELLTKYLDYMHPSFYGVTGEIPAIRQLAQQFNTIFIHEKADKDGNYFVTHSDSMALVNPQGQYVGMFRGPYQKDSMLSVLSMMMN